MYHIVCPTKYRKSIFNPKIEKTLKEVCVEISDRYEIIFLEIGEEVDYLWGNIFNPQKTIAAWKEAFFNKPLVTISK